LTKNDNGLIQLPSEHSFSETFERLESVLQSKGLTIFARIDFSGDAEKAGLKMNPTKMLIFGSPRAGTPLMIESPTLAIDLPLKILVSANQSGETLVTYNSPEYLKNRHHISDDLLKNISGVALIAQSITH